MEPDPRNHQVVLHCDIRGLKQLPPALSLGAHLDVQCKVCRAERRVTACFCALVPPPTRRARLALGAFDWGDRL
jgi:hypothetical protein